MRPPPYLFWEPVYHSKPPERSEKSLEKVWRVWKKSRKGPYRPFRDFFQTLGGAGAGGPGRLFCRLFLGSFGPRWGREALVKGQRVPQTVSLITFFSAFLKHAFREVTSGFCKGTVPGAPPRPSSKPLRIPQK